MTEPQKKPLTADELAAESAQGLPDKEVVSLLDLNADLDLAIDAAAPINLAVAANANVAAPIDAAVAANILSGGSTAQSLADQNVVIGQNVDADATANSTQASNLDQSNDVIDDGGATGGTSGDGGSVDGATTIDETSPSTVEEAVGGDLLDVDVNLAADADIAAPIDGAVAANANVAAPIDAAVSANIGSVDSEATAVAQQDAVINQNIEGAAEANADQTSDIDQ
jgi:hypothetical protein